MDNMLKSAPGVWWYVSAVARWLVIPLLMLVVGISPEEAGERALCHNSRRMTYLLIHLSGANMLLTC